MKRYNRGVAATVLAAAFGMSSAWAGDGAQAEAGTKQVLVDAADLRMAKAQKTASALRAATSSQRSSLYGTLAARGGRLAYAEMPLAVPLPALSDADDTEHHIELELLKRDGDPVAVLYSQGDDDDGTVYHGYSLSTGASLTRTFTEVNSSRTSYLLVETDGKEQLRDLVAETNAQLPQQLAALNSGAPARMTWGKSAAGMPEAAPPASTKNVFLNKATLFSKIHSIRADDRIKAAGDAEVYVIIVGLSAEGEPLMEVRQLEYFDRRHTTYTPNQNIVTWGTRDKGNGQVDWDRAPWVELIFMEYDRKESYQEVVQIALEKIGEVAVAAGANPAIGLAGQAASAIVGAIPEYVFKGEDDYLDSFYLVQYQELQGHGAANNINLHLLTEEVSYHTAPMFVDLAAKQLVAAGGSFYPWQRVSTSLGVKNEGNLPSQGWSAKFYLVPTNGAATPILVATGTAGGLNPGESFAKQFNLPLDGAALTPGTYRLRVVLDAEGDNQASNDYLWNNYNSLITVKPAPGPGDLIWAKPDLKAGYIIGVPGSYYASSQIETWFGFDNNGGGTGNFDVHFWAIHQSSGLVSYLAKGQSGGLAGGQSYGGIVNLPLTGLVPGQYKLIMQIGGIQGEAWTNNNIVPSIGTVTIVPNLTGELGQ